MFICIQKVHAEGRGARHRPRQKFLHRLAGVARHKEDGVFLRKRAEEIVSLLDRTEQQLTAAPAALHGSVSLGGWPNAFLLRAMAAFRRRHPDVLFEFYSSDATEVTERLDHGSLDFAFLLEPVDAVKYEYLSLPTPAHWWLLLPEDSPLAQKSAITREDLPTVPLILHRRAGLQRMIARWAGLEVEKLSLAATYNVISGDPATLVQSGLGCLLASDSHLPHPLAPGLCFRPLSPPLTLSYALVWKRYAPLSPAAAGFLAELRACL